MDGNLCAAVSPKGTKPGPIANAKDTVILTDTSRFGTADTSAMVSKLGQLATATNGVVVDLAGPGRVRDLQVQADANPGCVYAQNLVAQAAKDVVDAYRKGNTSGGVKYVVLAGGDNVVPFFRYPDTSSIGPEVNYFPPAPGRPPPPRPASAATTCWARMPTARPSPSPSGRSTSRSGPPRVAAARGDPG